MHLCKGDRVKGLYSHKGKLGTVLEESLACWSTVSLKWDGGKRVSCVEKASLRLLGENNDKD